MIPPPGPGRPLDPSEARQFELIVQGLPELTLDPVPDTAGDPLGDLAADPEPPAPTPPPAPPRTEPITAAHATTANPLPRRHAAAVLLVAAACAALIAVLPHPLNLWTPVVLFSSTAVLSVIWGWRRSRRRDT